MEAKSLEIHITPRTKNCKVFLDGKDISQRVYRVRIDADVHNVTSTVMINGYEVNEQGAFFMDPEHPHRQAKEFVIKGRFIEDTEGSE